MKSITNPILVITLALALSSCVVDKPVINHTSHIYSPEYHYSNPVIPGFTPDPSVCKAGSDYYVVNSSFEYFPGVPVFHSRDLVNWKQVGNALDTRSKLDLSNAGVSGGIWAPVIRYHEGTFYMITTLMQDGKNFFVTSTDPAEGWSEPIWIDMKNIDPSLFFDDDGKVYYTGTVPWDGNGPEGVYQAEIDMETGELLTEYRHIWSGTGGRYSEGPHLYKIDGWYYLMISEGGTETAHTITIARADNPWGPFEPCPFNPILTNRTEPYSNPVQNSGHGDLIQDDEGRWWMIHLAVRNVNKHHHLGRETFLLPVNWDDDGWPVVNEDGVSRLTVNVAPIAIQQERQKEFEYDFTRLPGPEWNYIRNPEEKNYSFNTKEGYLELIGTELSLDSLGSPTFLGSRQAEFEAEIVTEMEFNPEMNGAEAGITAFMTPDHYYTISLYGKNGRSYIRNSMKIGKIKHIAFDREIAEKRVYLKIKSDKENYYFFYSTDGKKWIEMSSNFARLLSSETAGTFTGTYLGLFASGNGQKTNNPAKFYNFMCRYQ